jgi:uncharacterized membrane protein (GlpM family)
MDFAFGISLLTKGIWSAAIVLGLAAIAERIGPRVAGILSGAPLSAFLVYFFVGRDMGVDYVVASVPHGIAAFTATLAFVLAYYGTSRRLTRFAAAGSTLVAVAVFAVVAGVLVAIPFTLAGAGAVTICAIGLSIWLFRKIEFVSVENPVRYTARLLLLRGGLAATLIVIVITLAEALGPRWTGLLTGFPATLLPTLLIIHATYGAANTHALMRNFPVGMASIVLYILSVTVTFPLWGVYGGTAASLAVSLAYLSIVMVWDKARPARNGARSP